MDVADLVGVHEAGIAHHVAAVGEVDGEHRAAAVADGAGAVLVQIFVVVRGNVAAREILLDPFEEFRVDGHHVFVLAVDGAFLHHPDLAVALDDLRFDLADLLVHQVAPILLAADDRFARFFHAARAQRIGLPRPAECRLGLLPRLQQRLIRPLGREGWIRIVLVEDTECVSKVTPAALHSAQSNDFQMRLRTVMGMARTSVSSELRKSNAIELYEAAVRLFAGRRVNGQLPLNYYPPIVCSVREASSSVNIQTVVLRVKWAVSARERTPRVSSFGQSDALP